MKADTSNRSHDSPTPNERLRQLRLQRGWTLQEVADGLYELFQEEDHSNRGPGINADTVGRWERGVSRPNPRYRAKLRMLFAVSDEDLGFAGDGKNAEPGFFTNFHNGAVNLSAFDLGVADKLDNAESIINLAWEAWFASRPREAARSVNKLLPSLERIAYSPSLPIHTLRAKELTIRAHGLLGSVCLDALQNDTALFHYMQAHRFAEEIHNVDLVAIYLCLVGDALRRQNDRPGALRHMENARDLASEASHTRGHILQLLAYTYGDTGQAAAFERTISEATDLLAFSGAGIDTSQKEFIPFEVYEIRGKINRELGKPLNAIPYLDLAEKSLATADSVTPRFHALLEISRAQAYCDAGDITTGIELACKGFLMAYQCHSPHQMDRVRKLLRKLENGPFRNHPRVQDLKNLLYETYMRMDSEDLSRNFPLF